jgi:hypothetical protein
MKKTILCLIVLFLLMSSGVAVAGELKLETSLSGKIKYDVDIIPTLDWKGILVGSWPHFQITVGKGQSVWGEGRTDTLGLSRTSPTIPQVGYRVDYFQFNYTHSIFPLERSENRWLFAHRFETNLIPHLRVGVWETMMCSDNVYPGYFLSMPFMPFYAIQHVAYRTSGSIYDMDSNAMFGLDFHYQINGGWDIYGELVVDDFPQRRIYGNPRKIGGLFGLLWNGWKDQGLTIWSEYVRINNFVYTHKNPSTRYLYRGEHFGHWLGMDGDLVALGVEKQFGEKDYLSGQFHLIRKGEGDYNDNWQSEDGNGLEFLSGVVEHRTGIELTWKHQVSFNLAMQTEAELAKIWNANNQPEVEKLYVVFAVKLNYAFDTSRIY